MAVIMILPFFREEFDGSCQSLACLYRLLKSLIGQLHIEQISFPAQLCRRMSVGIRYQLIAVQRGKAPVHGRIRGKPRFHGMNIRCQVFIAFLYRVKP